MAKYTVIAEFIDLQAGVRRRPGDELDLSEERALLLRGRGLIAAPVSGLDPGAAAAPVPAGPRPTPAPASDVAQAPPPVTEEVTPVGGGWYELPDGRRVRGREAALGALTAGAG